MSSSQTESASTTSLLLFETSVPDASNVTNVIKPKDNSSLSYTTFNITVNVTTPLGEANASSVKIENSLDNTAPIVPEVVLHAGGTNSVGAGGNGAIVSGQQGSPSTGTLGSGSSTQEFNPNALALQTFTNIQISNTNSALFGALSALSIVCVYFALKPVIIWPNRRERVREAAAKVAAVLKRESRCGKSEMSRHNEFSASTTVTNLRDGKKAGGSLVPPPNRRPKPIYVLNALQCTLLLIKTLAATCYAVMVSGSSFLTCAARSPLVNLPMAFAWTSIYGIMLIKLMLFTKWKRTCIAVVVIGCGVHLGIVISGVVQRDSRVTALGLCADRYPILFKHQYDIELFLEVFTTSMLLQGIYSRQSAGGFAGTQEVFRQLAENEHVRVFFSVVFVTLKIVFAYGGITTVTALTHGIDSARSAVVCWALIREQTRVKKTGNQRRMAALTKQVANAKKSSEEVGGKKGRVMKVGRILREESEGDELVTGLPVPATSTTDDGKNNNGGYMIDSLVQSARTIADSAVRKSTTSRKSYVAPERAISRERDLAVDALESGVNEHDNQSQLHEPGVDASSFHSEEVSDEYEEHGSDASGTGDDFLDISVAGEENSTQNRNHESPLPPFRKSRSFPFPVTSTKSTSSFKSFTQRIGRTITRRKSSASRVGKDELDREGNGDGMV
ncbi:hypothetical protein DFS34DRAFT_614831 [Phlyctochytrium arcticum]|nr:hypothetical protein DFS34DRAFT_614831 [Phlyctochytrium arcticum]